MGELYFNQNSGTGTQGLLERFFIDRGLELEVKKPMNEGEYFNRVSKFTDSNGLSFSVVWYTNLTTIILGGENSQIEFSFNKIIGSYLPREGCNSYDFYDGINKIATIRFKCN